MMKPIYAYNYAVEGRFSFSGIVKISPGIDHDKNNN